MAEKANFKPKILEELAAQAEAAFISVHFRDREIRYTPGTSIPERLRLICNPELLTPHWRGIFVHLFPDDIPPAEFNPDSVYRSPLTRFNDRQKKLHKQLLNSFGFESPKLLSTTSPLHVEELNIGFTNERTALANRMNELPLIQRLGDLGQTDPQLKTTPERLRLKMTRLQHSQDFARSVIMTNLRLAIIDPELYLVRVNEDMRRYSVLSQGFLGKSLDFSLTISAESQKFVDQFAGEYFKSKRKKPDQKTKDNLIQAIYAAYEYGKYMLFYAYIHDLKTTAFGDTVMKIKPEEEQKGLSDSKSPEKPFSEDEELKNFFDNLLDNEETGFKAVARDFGLDMDLFRVMVKSLASEGDPCLPGFLMKDKHKYPDIVLREFPWLREKIQSFDHDQRSGTRTNAAEIFSEYLPGGFKHISHEHTIPIGSFEDRLRLLAYAIATGMTKDELGRILYEMQINTEDIFIASEEFDFGPNIKLQPVFLPDREGNYHEEILPVGLDPGAAKRIGLLLNMLTLLYYNSEERAGIEKIFQDMVGSCLYGDGRTSLIREEVFKIGTDTTVSEYLYNNARLIAAAFGFFSGKTRLVTEEELRELIEDHRGKGLYYLAKKADLSHLVNAKPGTLVARTTRVKKMGEIVEEKIEGVDYWVQVTRKRRGETEDNPLSVPRRLEKTAEFLQSGKFYHFISLTPAQWAELEAMIYETEETAPAVLRALFTWQIE